MKQVRKIFLGLCSMLCSNIVFTAAHSVVLPPLIHMLQKTFFSAVYAGDYATVQTMHEAGIDINSRDNNGRTALSRLVSIDKKKLEDNHLEVVRYLLKNSAHVSASDIAQVIPSRSQVLNIKQQKLLALLKKHSTVSAQVIAVGSHVGMLVGVAGVMFGYPLLGLSMLEKCTSTRQSLMVGGVWLSGGVIGLSMALKKIRSHQEVDPHFPA